MARPTAVEIADQMTGGKVSARMRDLRDSGATYDSITAALEADFGLSVDRVTVTRWFQRDRAAGAA